MDTVIRTYEIMQVPLDTLSMRWKPDIVIDFARGGSDDFYPVISNQICECKCQNQKELQLQPDIHHGVAIMDIGWAIKCPEQINGQKNCED